MSAREKNYSSEPLTPDENRRLRAMLEADERAHWFWSIFRTWIMYMSGVAVAIGLLYDQIARVLKAIVR